MHEETVKRELSKDEIEKLGRHAGQLAKQIELMETARKEEMDSAKQKIDDIRSELAEVHQQLRDGYKLEPAQREIGFGHKEDSRLDDVRKVVRNARKRHAHHEQFDHDDEE